MLNDVLNPQLQLAQVSLSAAEGRVSLLQNISFQVAAGEFVAIVGPSGAGKTSLLRLLNRLSEPTSGTIYWADRALTEVPPVQLRQQVMLVMQEPKLLEMTVKATLAYPLQLRGLGEAAIQKQVVPWLERLQIPNDWLSRTALQLSLGQRQRVAVARALIAQPKILLLDEPTSALDLGHATHLLTVLSELAQTQQMTILMVNHQLDFAQKFCTRLLYLQQGKLTQDTPTEAVDWSQLRQDLLQLQAQDAMEWGEG